MNRRMVRVLTAPFSRRSWAALGYLLVSVPLAVAGFAFAVVTAIPPLLGVSAPGVRAFGDANRGLARELLGDDGPPPSHHRAKPSGGSAATSWSNCRSRWPAWPSPRSAGWAACCS